MSSVQIPTSSTSTISSSAMNTSPFATPQARWTALTHRLPSADGHFVYAVRTTRIYCRPTCPARLARRANVAFYDLPAQAEAAGYRACKRCRPNMSIDYGKESASGVEGGDGGVATKFREGESVRRRVRTVIQAEKARRCADAVVKPRSTEALAKEAGVSKWHFHRVVKEMTGCTPAEYFIQAKAEAQEKISTRDQQIDALWPSLALVQGTPFSADLLQMPQPGNTLDFDLLNLDFMVNTQTFSPSFNDIIFDHTAFTSASASTSDLSTLSDWDLWTIGTELQGTI